MEMPISNQSLQDTDDYYVLDQGLRNAIAEFGSTELTVSEWHLERTGAIREFGFDPQYSGRGATVGKSLGLAALFGLCFTSNPAMIPVRIPTSTPTDPVSYTAPIRQTSVKHMKEHIDFLRRMTEGPVPPISRQTAQRATEVWFELWTASGQELPIPAASAGPDGQVFYAWDRGRYHFEVEIIPDQDIEYFYRDRNSGEHWNVDLAVGSQVPACIRDTLKFFV